MKRIHIMSENTNPGKSTKPPQIWLPLSFYQSAVGIDRLILLLHLGVGFCHIHGSLLKLISNSYPHWPRFKQPSTSYYSLWMFRVELFEKKSITVHLSNYYSSEQCYWLRIEIHSYIWKWLGNRAGGAEIFKISYKKFSVQ